jgi:hypothetical protein
VAFLLENRAALRRKFYILTGSTSDDDALNEQDAETNEMVHYYIQMGLWAAQERLISRGMRSRWLATSGALEFSSSATEDTGGGRYADLPADFLRLAGDEQTSGVRQPDGCRWGQQIDDARLFSLRGDFFALRNEQLWVTRGANLPAALVLGYYQRHAVLVADDTDLDFPEHLRDGIVAEAGSLAAQDSWLPGGPEMQAKIDEKVTSWRKRAAAWARQTRQPRTLRAPDTFGSHWY